MLCTLRGKVSGTPTNSRQQATHYHPYQYTTSGVVWCVLLLQWREVCSVPYRGADSLLAVGVTTLRGIMQRDHTEVRCVTTVVYCVHTTSIPCTSYVPTYYTCMLHVQCGVQYQWDVCNHCQVRECVQYYVITCSLFSSLVVVCTS